jgi:anti-sigma B factor antagonist
MLFDVRTSERDGWTVVQVTGDVDLATLPVLRQALDRATGAAVALDLSGVDLFDPLAFGVVLSGALRATRQGARFAVICPEGRPRQLFAETRLDEILEIGADVASLPVATDAQSE